MKICILTVGYLLAIVNSQDRYTDENRPYKFGFNIEGHQHRKEEKDEKGIIKGEYGFITADGYYRVTIYETDENNDFKIISMKNYYVGFPPGDPTTTPPPAASRNPQNQRLLPLARTDEFSTPGVKTSTEQTTRHPGIGGGACSGCFLPTTTESPKLNKTVNQGIQGLSKKTNAESQQNRTNSQVYENNRLNNKPDSRKIGRPEAGERNSRIDKTIPTNIKHKNGNALPETPKIAQGRVKESLRKNTHLEKSRADNEASAPPTPNVKSNVSILLPLKNDVDTLENPKNVESKAADNEKSALLYRFNYTVGFHGHHEDGFKNGYKTGDYFVNSRDGDSRKVTYVANEFGYQPNITLIKLQDGDESYPKEDTEKEYGLKGYEFKWFYRK